MELEQERSRLVAGPAPARRWRRAGAALVIGGAVASHALSARRPRAAAAPTAEALAAAASRSADDGDDAAVSLTWSVWNSYTRLSPVTLYPWAKLAEPHREHTFEVTRVNGRDDDDAAVEYAWRIDGTDYAGPSASGVVFATIGAFSVSVRATAVDSGEIVGEDDGQVMCKYVRRELRALSDPDRDALLDAMHVLYTVDASDGRYRFGSAYRDASWFSRLHLEGAAARECDHWHDNAGLMVHHMSFTLLFEQTLQLIDKRIAMPYWDYSLDAHALDTDWANSTIFADDWFGRASPLNGEHIVDRGRWAYLGIRQNARAFSNITNAYGFLRSPWNTEPRPYLTRSKMVLDYPNAGYETLPTCADMKMCFNSTSVSSMNECLNGYTHGPVHIMVGGQFDAADVTVSMNMLFSTQRIQLLLFKVLWRMGYATCPEQCGDEFGVEKAACRCSCPKELYSDAYDVLHGQTGLLHWIDAVSDRIYYDEDEGLYHVKDYHFSDEQSTWHALLDAMCDPGWVGELYTSNAPADPLFWPIHTAAERLLSWKRILKHRGLVDFDETWGYALPSAVPSDFGRVCDWSRITNATKLPYCHVATCPGHRAWDTVPAMPEFTNEQFYEFMDPYNPGLPYVYDNFYWDHCDRDGYELSSYNWISETPSHGTAGWGPGAAQGDDAQPAETAAGDGDDGGANSR